MACLESRDEDARRRWKKSRRREDEGVTIYTSRSIQAHPRATAMVTSRASNALRRHVHAVRRRADWQLETQCQAREHVLPMRRGDLLHRPASRSGLHPEGRRRGHRRAQATIAVNPNTSPPRGPACSPPATASPARRSSSRPSPPGTTVAEAIHRYLRGEELEPKPKPRTAGRQDDQGRGARSKIARGESQGHAARQDAGARSVTQRAKTALPRSSLGYTDEEAQAEAARCLACGICSECLSCWYECGVNAIDHDMVERIEQIKVGAVILAPGYEIYNAKLSQEYGLGRYPNVVTSLQFERLLSASGPTDGHVQRPSDGSQAEKDRLPAMRGQPRSEPRLLLVGVLHVRRQRSHHGHRARQGRARRRDHAVECHVFFMDTRAFSKGYEEYYQRAREKVRRAVSPDAHQRRQAEPGEWQPHRALPRTAERSRIRRGIRSGGALGRHGDQRQGQGVGHDLGIELDDYGFCHTTMFDPLRIQPPGIYVAGPFREPKDIPESVVEASGAAAAAEQLLAPARGTLARKVEYPPERDVTGEEPRVGVFVCHCGSNIGGYLDVPGVAEYAKSLPVRRPRRKQSLHLLAGHSQAHHRAGQGTRPQPRRRRLLHAAHARAAVPGSPCAQAGLNPYLFEMANIRNQCSWVHSDDREAATRKGQDLVRMAAARAARLEPLHTTEMPVEKTALVIGGGAAGMNAALSLAEQGFPVHLVERTDQLGGNLRNVFFLIDASGKQPEVRTPRSTRRHICAT